MRPLFAPDHLYVELTNRCTRRCLHCYLGASPEGRLEARTAVVKGVIEEFASIGGRSVTLSGGEPLLHADWGEIACHARALGCAVIVVTNGGLVRDATLATLEDLDAMIALSVEGARPEPHDSLRGAGSFTEISSVLDLLDARGAHGRTIVCVTPTRRNVADVTALVRRVTQRGFRRYYISVLEDRGRAREQRAVLSLALDDQVRLLTHLALLLSDRDLQANIDCGHFRYFFARLLGDWSEEGEPVEGTLRVDPRGLMYLTSHTNGERFLLGDLSSQDLSSLLRTERFRRLRGALRDRATRPSRCMGCFYWALCRGGSAVRAYAAYGALDVPDDFCRAKRLFLKSWFHALSLRACATMVV